MPWLAHLGLLLLSWSAASVLTPVVVRFCERSRAFDQPDERKLHNRCVGRLGGVAIFAALSLGLTAAVYAVMSNQLDVFVEQARLIPVLYLGLCGFFFIGFLDDLHSIPALWRLLAQFAVATAVVLLGGGTSLRVTHLFGDPTALPDWLSIVLTIMWIVGVVNTFNWIDGLDGLAAGIAVISATAFYVIALLKPGLPNAGLTMALCIMLVGAVLGFLRYNFQPARIFLGDGGAFSLGYLLAVVSVIGLFKTAAAISFVAPVAILVLPLGDTLFAILRRVAKRQPITQPDNRHIHHRILSWIKRRYEAQRQPSAREGEDEALLLGRAHRATVLSLYAFALAFASLAVWLGVRA
jgi:UDP-GlcNAc:undecaprenyl-phosphate GlcNAc-1-phosphate transferase